VVLPALPLDAAVEAPLAVPAVLAEPPVPAPVPPRPSTVDAAIPAREDLVAMPATFSSDCKILPKSPSVELDDDAPILVAAFDALDAPALRAFLLSP
jgi:hypothetical protein